MIGGFSVTPVAFSDALFKPSSLFIEADSFGNIALIRSKEQALCKQNNYRNLPRSYHDTYSSCYGAK